MAWGVSVTTVKQAGEYLPKELTEQNKHADIHIAHTALLHRVGNEKMKSALYVSVETVEQADFLCSEGMIWQGSWYPCEPFCEGAQVKQCYRRYDYGHVARHCRARQICGWCAQGHIEADCPAKDPASEQQLRCVQGGKPLHRPPQWIHIVDPLHSIPLHEPVRYIINPSISGPSGSGYRGIGVRCPAARSHSVWYS